MRGWIRLDRAIRDHWVWSESDALKLWIEMLMVANIKSKSRFINGQNITIQRGQLIFGRTEYSQRLGITESRLRRYLRMFEKERMIDRKIFHKYSIITIVCYANYQDVTAKKPQNDHKIATKAPHLDNKPVTINKFIKPTLDQVKKYCKEKRYNIDPEHFIDYYDTRDWTLGSKQKIKDWKACVRTWVRNANRNDNASEARTEVIL